MTQGAALNINVALQGGDSLDGLDPGSIDGAVALQGGGLATRRQAPSALEAREKRAACKHGRDKYIVYKRLSAAAAVDARGRRDGRRDVDVEV